MTRSRTLLLSLGLVLLGAAGTGVYLYQNLPELLRLQAERTLRQYGVDDIAFDGLRFTHSDASVDTLSLRGRHGNLAYQARLTGGALRYDWRALLTGKADSLSLSAVELSVVQTAASDSPSPAIITVEEFLPQRLITQLPVQTLRIKRWRASYRSLTDRTIDAHGSLTIDQQIDLRLKVPIATCASTAELHADIRSPDLHLALSMDEDQAGVATLTAELARSADSGWEWYLRGRTHHARLLSCLRELESRQELALGIPAETDLKVEGESVFSARIHHPDTLNLAAAPDADDAPLRQLTASVHLESNIHLDNPTLVDRLGGALTLDATLANARVSGILQPFSLTGNLGTQRLSLPGSWQRWSGWGETVPVFLETAEPLTITAGDNAGWSVQSRNTLLSLGDNDTRLRFEKLNLDVIAAGSAPVQATMQLGTSVNIRLLGQTLPQLAITATQRGTFEQSDFTLHLAGPAESVAVDLTGTLNPTTGRGDYQLYAHIDDLPYFTATTAPLLHHFELLEDNATIHSGTVKLTTALTSDDYDVNNWKQRSQLSARNISGSIDDYTFDNLDLTADWTGISHWQTLQPLRVSAAALNPGFAVKDFQLQVSLPQATPITQPHLRIDAFSASVFGGHLILPAVHTWDFAAPDNRLTLVAKGWQLGELVALQKNADIQAEGTLEGELPITVTAGRIVIDNGYLRALPPTGSIRYRANDKVLALADSNSELALALDLLNDFQYQALSGEVQLDKAGNLLLALSLEGSNPAQYGGQSIRFNINVEQNLDPLLQSLRIGDNLEQRIKGGMK